MRFTIDPLLDELSNNLDHGDLLRIRVIDPGEPGGAGALRVMH